MAKILRLPEVCDRTGLSRATLYLKIQSGHFPKQVPLGPRAVGWIESEVQDWIEQCVIAARGDEESAPAGKIY